MNSFQKIPLASFLMITLFGSLTSASSISVKSLRAYPEKYIYKKVTLEVTVRSFEIDQEQSAIKLFVSDNTSNSFSEDIQAFIRKDSPLYEKFSVKNQLERYDRITLVGEVKPFSGQALLSDGSKYYILAENIDKHFVAELSFSSILHNYWWLVVILAVLMGAGKANTRSD